MAMGAKKQCVAGSTFPIFQTEGLVVKTDADSNNNDEWCARVLINDVLNECMYDVCV